jgi:membrane protease YdiL (CAAX protease family)
MRDRTDARRHWIVLLSPIPVAGICRASQLAGRSLGVWAWLPTMVTFWALLGGLIVWGRKGKPIAAWFGPVRKGTVWSVLAVAVGLISVREFIAGWAVLGSPSVMCLWLAFGLVNPWFEEVYWRGLLIDAAGDWSGIGVVYSTLAFAGSHPLVWGVYSVALRHPAALFGLAVVGGVWGVAYWRTGSLRWTVVGHGLADLLGLSVPMLLNLYVPAGLRQ